MAGQRRNSESAERQGDFSPPSRSRLTGQRPPERILQRRETTHSKLELAVAGRRDHRPVMARRCQPFSRMEPLMSLRLARFSVVVLSLSAVVGGMLASSVLAQTGTVDPQVARRHRAAQAAAHATARRLGRYPPRTAAAGARAARTPGHTARAGGRSTGRMRRVAPVPSNAPRRPAHRHECLRRRPRESYSRSNLGRRLPVAYTPAGRTGARRVQAGDFVPPIADWSLNLRSHEVAMKGFPEPLPGSRARS